MDNENVSGQEQEQQEQGQQQQQQQEQGGGEKTFTQAEVDTMINTRLARERKNQPTQAQVDSARADVSMLKRENFLLRQGVDPEDVDFFAYKITKSMENPNDDDDFEDAAKAFLKEHKAGKHGSSGVRVDLGGRLSGDNGKKTANQQMNDLLRRARGTVN